jgi:hypothetical protein
MWHIYPCIHTPAHHTAASQTLVGWNGVRQSCAASYHASTLASTHMQPHGVEVEENGSGSHMTHAAAIHTSASTNMQPLTWVG